MKKIRIMLIEDDTDIIAINKEYLELQGYEVVYTQTLKMARFHIEEQVPDIIILDVLMPDGLGWDFSKEIRKKINTPIIFLTCKGENEDIVRCLLDGADDYIIKPYDLNVLGARIAAQLRRSGILHTGIIELPPLTIDLLAGEVKFFDEIISLTQKEIQLLACFAIYVGRRLSCDEIYKRTWGGKVKNSNQVIAVHVANLRKKLNLNENSCFELKNTRNGEYIFSKIKYID